MDQNLLKVDDPVYQTLSDFLVHPFGVAVTDVGEKLNPKYEKFKSLISVVSYSILDESYYIMPKTETMEKEQNLNSYVIQFFSNSPSFIYKYAALYKLHGYMIDALQEKLDPNYANALPEKANAKMELMYDKSIYFATKYLFENRLTYLSKSSLRYTKKISFRELVDSILDNESSLKTSAYDVEKKAIAEGKVDRSKVEKAVNKLLGNKRPPGININQKKVATKSTLTDSRSVVKPKKTGTSKKGKISPTISTKRRG